MTAVPITILIVEDEQAIRRFVRAALENEGWRVTDADGLQRGLIEAATRQPDLIILDLGLPDGDGMEFIRDLRRWSAIPVIVLSARCDEADKVETLDTGAEDFLSKPFGVAELLARVRVALRRHTRQQQEIPQICFADVQVDLLARNVTRHGELLHLTPIEFRLLAELIANSGKVLTQRQLLSSVWGAKLRRAQPLPAHLYGTPAPKAGGGTGPSTPPADRNRRWLPLYALAHISLAYTRNKYPPA